MKPEPALKRINAAQMPEDIASAWEASMALRGDATFFEVFANHPDLYRWYVGSFYGEVFRGAKVANPIKSCCASGSPLSTVAASVIKGIVVTHWRLG